MANRNVTMRKVTRSDRWVNERNQFGGDRDPTTRTTFFRDVTMTRDFLESLFRYDWLTRRAVEIPAQDATRKWIKLKHDNPKRVQEAERELSRLAVQEKFEELIILGRLYGGGVLVIGAWDGRDVMEPLGEVREIRFLANVDRYLAYPQTFYRNPQDPKYGNIETYLVTRPHVIGSDVAVVHETRIVRLDGNYLPPLERIRNFTYGASIVENILEATRGFGIATQGLAGVIQDFVVKKLKVDNLQDLLSTPEGQNTLMSRLGELAAGMSMYGVATFGPDEEFDKIGTPVTGLSDLADRFVEYASAATGIPRSRLFSNLSGILGGDAGENDLRVHYDNIEAYQKNRLSRDVQRLIDVCLYPLGFEPGEMQFEWNKLWQLSDKEQAEVRNFVAQSDVEYINAGVVEPEEVAMTRFAGDGINLNDMNIETKPREEFLKAFKESEPRDPNAEAEQLGDGTPDGPDVGSAKPKTGKNGNGKDKGAEDDALSRTKAEGPEGGRISNRSGNGRATH